MPPTLERHLLKSVQARLHAIRQQDSTLAWRKRHGSAFATAGDPDIYGVWRSIPFEIELKTPRGLLSHLQSHRLEEWRETGSLCFVVTSLAELESALNQIRAKFRD